MAKDDSASQPSSHTGQAPGKSESIAAGCRAARISGMDGFAECLTPMNCQFLFTYGHGHFCTHPQRAKIVARTEATGPGS